MRNKAILYYKSWGHIPEHIDYTHAEKVRCRVCGGKGYLTRQEGSRGYVYECPHCINGEELRVEVEEIESDGF